MFFSTNETPPMGKEEARKTSGIKASVPKVNFDITAVYDYGLPAQTTRKLRAANLTVA